MMKGRGSASNPPNRFEKTHRFIEEEESGMTLPVTQFLQDCSRSIIAYNNSPDVGFEASINPYRGCEHGCVYCYARPTHEYLGYSAGLDFETKIMVKEDAPLLLRKELQRPAWKPQVLAMSGVTDPYQPVEGKRRLTRQCLEVLLEFRNPVVIITKNRRVVRDLDLLSELAAFQSVAVFLSITTLNGNLCAVLEPRTSPPDRKLEAVSILAKAGVPTGVLVAPVIPGLTDHEIPNILRSAAAAGAAFAGVVPLRLPYAVAPLFETWLERYLPDQKEKVLNRIRSVRGGKLNDPRFGSRMEGEGIFSDQIKSLFNLACRKYGIAGRPPLLSTAHFRSSQPVQEHLF
ncbi:PA0069 family radical SAM protein [Candidatus Manganitrophus noduliformans]|uniref:PA0069 family radical SAM protein n=1 Tax=Candidatus Manganitrophus noduliformans TaxID=2606439 RepID=A0A7X6DPD0_9BACT|nr:PA0069 family radical SAM protein [Candidatus Manganitrophus noduliformans]NKE70921.1 PA0069 family radical SAM protein [Candidatus Manganitrophus noduliformans]